MSQKINIQQLLSELNQRAIDLLHLQQVYVNQSIDWARVDLLSDQTLSALHT